MSIFHVSALVAASLLSMDDNGHDTVAEQPPSAVRAEGPAPVRADDPQPRQPAEEPARLRKLWADWKLRATSIEVEGFEFVGSFRTDDPTFSRQELMRLIQETLPTLMKPNQAYDLPTLRSATEHMFPPPTPENIRSKTYGRWAEISLVREAENVRFDTTIDDRTRSTVRRGPIEQSYSTGSRQASVFTMNGGLRIPGSDTFIYGPSLPSEALAWQRRGNDPTRMHLSAEGDRGKATLLDYDSVSGFVEYHGVRFSETQFRMERFQFHPALNSDGIPLPRFVAEINYNYFASRQALAHRVTMYVLSSVEIGNKIDRSEFNLSVPGGTNVVLFEGAPGEHRPDEHGRPAMAFTKKTVDDAAEFTQSADFRNAQTRKLP